jgi:hypothetical protein
MSFLDWLDVSWCLLAPGAFVALVLFLGSGSKAGVYIYRTRKPGALLGWPVIGRHTAYVGQTKSFGHRHRQHIGKPLPHDPYASTGKPWADLGPRCYRIPLPAWRWLLWLVEWILIKMLLPVYNINHNKSNPRRITQYRAIHMRRTRDLQGQRGIVLGVGVRLLTALRWYHFVGSVALAAGMAGWLA